MRRLPWIYILLTPLRPSSQPPSQSPSTPIPLQSTYASSPLSPTLSSIHVGFFAAIAMDLHMDLQKKTQSALLEERRTNDARRAFMKYLFHEVRTPLNSLTMGIDMLKMSETMSAEEKDYLEMMQGATEFMSDTLNNVLNMHKIEEGKLELEFAPFSIMEVVEKSLSALHGAIVGRNINIKQSVPEDLPYLVNGDRFRVIHVMSNLLSNAIKFSPESGVSITHPFTLLLFTNTPPPSAATTGN